ncbi:hypothetical protein PRIPAC_73263, partial [Pristionchus pacificus]|uniref:Uncharacterized protein n=1 Tax=Pristionchus pacificus TaxID=54126 RepID=A0A2A6BZW5_PRIPA
MKFVLVFSILSITVTAEKVRCDANVVKETPTGELIPLPLLKYCPDVVYFVCG